MQKGEVWRDGDKLQSVKQSTKLGKGKEQDQAKNKQQT